MWSNLGINYNYDGTGYNYAVDLPLLYKTGFRSIRLLVENWDNAAGITLWKTICQAAIAQGFTEIIFGLTFENYSVANQAAFTTAQNSLATWFTQQTLSAGQKLVFCLGNEEQNHISDGSSTTQVAAYYRTRYTAIKAILTNATANPVTYSMANNEMFNFYNDFNGSSLPYPWDYPSANLYSYATGQSNATSFTQNISNASAWFGLTNFVISELGPDPSGYSDSSFRDRTFYAQQFAQNLTQLRKSGVTKAYIYNFQDANFGCMDTNRNFRPWWYILTAQAQPAQLGTG